MDCCLRYSQQHPTASHRPAFVQVFSIAANLAAADPVPDRRVQRIPFGALAFKSLANGEQT